MYIFMNMLFQKVIEPNSKIDTSPGFEPRLDHDHDHDHHHDMEHVHADAQDHSKGVQS
jgi:hypothetical protein